MTYKIKPTGKLLLNRWMTKDSTILTSRHKHDFQMHFDIVDQQYVFVDGGLDYSRISGGMIDLCRYDVDEHHEDVSENYMWTSFGVNGDEPAKKQAVKDLDSKHIEAIIRTQVHLPEQVLNMFKRELNFRNKE